MSLATVTTSISPKHILTEAELLADRREQFAAGVAFAHTVAPAPTNAEAAEIAARLPSFNAQAPEASVEQIAQAIHRYTNAVWEECQSAAREIVALSLTSAAAAPVWREVSQHLWEMDGGKTAVLHTMGIYNVYHSGSMLSKHATLDEAKAAAEAHWRAAQAAGKRE